MTVLLATAATALSSCVGLESSVTIAADGTGTADLRYVVPAITSPLGALDGDDRLIPLPISREEFERAARGVEGLEILEYSQREETDSIAVAARLAFSSPRALAAFIDPRGELASYSEEGGRRTLRFVPAAGGRDLAPQVDALVDAAFEPYAVSLTVALPTPALSIGVGASSRGGREVRFASSAAALAKSVSRIEWTLVW